MLRMMGPRWNGGLEIRTGLGNRMMGWEEIRELGLRHMARTVHSGKLV